MVNNNPYLDLQDYRKAINKCDKKLLQILEERMEVSLEIGKIKKQINKPVFDPEREKAVIEKLQKSINSNIEMGNNSNLSDDFISDLWSVIFKHSKELQK